MIKALRHAATRWQNRLLTVMLDSFFSDLDVYSYPRGRQLRRAIRDDSTAAVKGLSGGVPTTKGNCQT